MSWLRYMTLKSFRDLNPDVDMRLHTTGSVDCEFADVRTLCDVVTHDPLNLPPNHEGDIIRWRTLAKEPCLFMDMDIVFVNPVSAFDFSTDAITHKGGFFYIGMVASAGNSRLFQAVAEIAERRAASSLYQSAGVDALYELAYGPGVFRPDGIVDWALPEGLDSLSKLGPCANLPYELLHWYEPDRMLAGYGGPDKRQVLGLHWSGGSSYGLHAEQHLNPSTLDTMQGPLVAALKGEL